MTDFDRLRETVEEMKKERDGAIVDNLIPDIAKTYRTDFLSLWSEMSVEEQILFIDTFADETNAFMEGKFQADEYACGIEGLIDGYADIVAERKAWAIVKGNKGE